MSNKNKKNTTEKNKENSISKSVEKNAEEATEKNSELADTDTAEKEVKNKENKEKADTKKLDKTGSADNKKRNFIIGASAAAVLALIVLIVVINHLSKQSRPVFVAESTGTVEYYRNPDASGKEYKEGELRSGDSVSVGNASSAVITIDDDKSLYLSENTGLSIESVGFKSSETVSVNMLYGDITMSMNGVIADNASFTIYTPVLNVYVIDAEFKLSYDEETAYGRIDVTRGSVNISSMGQIIPVNTGDTVIVRGEEILDGTTVNIDAYLAKEEAERIAEENRIAEETAWASKDSDLSSAKVGDVVYYGRYEQDGNLENGEEPIAWDVLDVSDGRVLLVCHNVLAAMPYNDEDTRVTWETCSLRQWLNDEFYNSAFKSNEMAYILKTTVSNPDSYAFYDEFHEENTLGVMGGNDTEDYLFLLSYEEVLKYYEPEKVTGGWWKYASADFQVEATVASGIENYIFMEWDYNTLIKTNSNWPSDCVDRAGSSWWLRSPGDARDIALNVSEFGFLTGGSYVTCEYGVRPAMYVEY